MPYQNPKNYSAFYFFFLHTIMKIMGFLEFLKKNWENATVFYYVAVNHFDLTRKVRKCAKCIEMPTFDITVR